jgi:hypothetical protein
MESVPPFGPPKVYDPWATAVYGEIIAFTVGGYAHKGAMTGWWFFQVWG